MGENKILGIKDFGVEGYIVNTRSPLERRTQYSDLIPKDVFKIYKSASPKQKLEIENEVFRICRTVKEIPRRLVTVEDGLSKETAESLMIQMLRPLASEKTYQSEGIGDSYDGECYKLNPAGVDYLYSFFPNLWEVKKYNSSLSVKEGFLKDDVKLKKVIRKTLTYSHSMVEMIIWLRMVGWGFCNNFRPATAKAIYELFAPQNAKVFDYAAGYGARCLGAFFAENVKEYVSVDVNTQTVEGLNKLQNTLLNGCLYNGEKDLKTYLCGSEEFLNLYPQYKGYFDLSFSSPQYFNTEIYSDELTQSCHKYPNYKLWLKNFYRPTIHNAIDVLKEDGVFIINIFDKLPKVLKDNTSLDLRDFTKICAKEKGFYLYKSDKYLLRIVPGSVGKTPEGKPIKRKLIYDKSRFESVWVFRHYKTLYKHNLIDKSKYDKYKKYHGD